MTETHLEIKIDPSSHAEASMTETQQTPATQRDDTSCPSWLSDILEEDHVDETKSTGPPRPKEIPQVPVIPQVPIELKQKCYEEWLPLAVSIGPYHYKDRERIGLYEMEKLKDPMMRQFVKDCVRGCGKGKGKGEGKEEKEEERKVVATLYGKVKELTETAKKFYHEDVTKFFSDEAFERMMFIDGCFVLQFIHCVTGGYEDLKESEQQELKAFYDKLKTLSDQQVADVKRDLFLLENQLPFPVLKALMKERYKKGHAFMDRHKDEGMKRIEKFLPFRDQRKPFSTRSLILLLILGGLCYFGCYCCCWAATLTRPPIKKNGDQQSAASADGQQTTKKTTKKNGGQQSAASADGQQTTKKNGDQQSAASADGQQTTKKNGAQPPAQQSDQKGPAHLLQHLYSKFTGAPKGPATEKSQLSLRSRGHYLYYSAKDLKKVGIHFRPNGTGALTDVELSSSVFCGKLKLPPMTIDKSTKSMLLNLLAYESAAHVDCNVIPSYIHFMDSLIDDAEDVKELRSKGILFNYLGNDQAVAELFNGMSKSLDPETLSYYNDVKRDINKQCDSKFKKWVADWQHDYFSSPWSVIALTAAGFTIFLTAVATYVAVWPIN